ncbi:MAG: DUF2442 domain-containing protein [bacterium]
MKLREDAIIEITQADHLSDYRIRLKFSDCHEQTIDFEPFLRRSRHPEIRKYLDPELFKQFKIEYGDLIWNDYDLCFPIADLYEGRIE